MPAQPCGPDEIDDDPYGDKALKATILEQADQLEARAAECSTARRNYDLLSEGWCAVVERCEQAEAERDDLWRQLEEARAREAKLRESLRIIGLNGDNLTSRMVDAALVAVEAAKRTTKADDAT